MVISLSQNDYVIRVLLNVVFIYIIVANKILEPRNLRVNSRFQKATKNSMLFVCVATKAIFVIKITSPIYLSNFTSSKKLNLWMNKIMLRVFSSGFILPLVQLITKLPLTSKSALYLNNFLRSDRERDLKD